MTAPSRIAAFAVLASFAGSLPLLAADTLPWPWKGFSPADPALALLYQADGVSASVSDADILEISVEATAQTPGFTEVQLVPRVGNPDDRLFAFDLRGRPPQDMTIQVLKPISLDVAYADAPIDDVEVIEVYAQTNCKAFSLKDKKEVACTEMPRLE